MSTVEKLLERYKAEHGASGDVDPRPYLAQVSGIQRVELCAHIDRFLANATPRTFDAAAFARFRADAERNELVARVLDDATLGEVVKASGVKRIELSRRLADKLGLAGKERKVRGRLRDIESGEIAAERVRPAVWEALAEIVGESAERLRRAAENVATAPDLGSPAITFGRQARIDGPELHFSMAREVDQDEDDRLVDEVFFVD